MTCSFAQKILARANPAGVPQPIWSMLPPMVFRWESLTANALTIVALGEQELLSGVALILPPAKAVIAIADSVPCTAEVVLACESLKTAGYRLALAGWTGRKEQGPLAAMADFLLVGMRRLATVNERETKRADRTKCGFMGRAQACQEPGLPLFSRGLFLDAAAFPGERLPARGATQCACCRQF